MNKIEFFKAKIDATISPMDFMHLMKSRPDSIQLIDVRNAPPSLKKVKIAGAAEIPQMEIVNRLSELSKDKLIVVYCWDVWCNLGAKACITLLENGYDVMELAGGIAAWQTVKLPVEEITA